MKYLTSFVERNKKRAEKIGSERAKILTFLANRAIISSVRAFAPGGHQNGGGCFPMSKDARKTKISFFLPAIIDGEVILMYVTWEELLLLLSAIIALLNYIRNIYNKKK